MESNIDSRRVFNGVNADQDTESDINDENLDGENSSGKNKPNLVRNDVNKNRRITRSMSKSS
mgnify:CR=1 FL=1